MRTEDFFWTLLRAALSGNDSNQIDYLPISDEVWQEIYHIGNVQGVSGILFSAIERLPKNQHPPLKLLMEWYGQTEHIRSFNATYREKACELIDIWASKGIRTVVLKGMTCAGYYPEPECRPLGDLDVFLMEDDESPFMGGHSWAYEEGNRLAGLCGAKVEQHDYKHSHISWRGLMVENHKFLTTCRGAKVKKEYERYLQSIVPSIQFEALFLITHAFQHFMEEELSVRQICDWAMFMKVHSSDVDWNDFYFWMNRMKMRRFADAMNYVIEVHLAIICNVNYSVDNVKYLADRLLQDVLHSDKEMVSSQNLLKYRLWQTKQFFADAWKYRVYRDENAVCAYFHKIWNHWFDEI